MTETKPEPTAFEKLQNEYQNLCASLGHVESQIDTLENQKSDLREKLRKCVRKSTQISQEAQKAAQSAAQTALTTEDTEGEKNGTNG